MPQKTENSYSIFQKTIRLFMRLFFHLLYHSMAWSYDLVSNLVSAGRWNSWILETARFTHGPRILELGYGPGHLQEFFFTSGYIPIGLDESQQMARQAARRIIRKGYPPHLVRGKAQCLPFPDASFDSIIASFPTEFIIDPDTIKEIYRLLRPNGNLVVLSIGWIMGNSLIDRSLAQLFKITGQAPDKNQRFSSFVEPFQKAGFKTKLRFVDRSDGRLMFIIATR